MFFSMCNYQNVLVISLRFIWTHIVWFHESDVYWRQNPGAERVKSVLLDDHITVIAN